MLGGADPTLERAGYELSSLARMATLQQLELSLDQGGAGSGAGGRSNGVMGPLAPLAHLARGAPGLPGQGAGGPCDGGVPGGGAAGAGGGEGEGGAPTELALHFRWTERVSALLRACQAHLVRGALLTLGWEGRCRSVGCWCWQAGCATTSVMPWALCLIDCRCRARA